MGNKTIYLSDEKLWKDAKKFAGAKGLSAVIADALRTYVTERKLELEGSQEWRFPAGPGSADAIAFKGKLLGQLKTRVFVAGEVWPPDAFEEFEFLSVQVEVYQTRAGTFIVVAEMERHDDFVPVYWKKYQSIAELKVDQAVMTLEPEHRAHLLDEVSIAAKTDWATWID